MCPRRCCQQARPPRWRSPVLTCQPSAGEQPVVPVEVVELNRDLTQPVFSTVNQHGLRAASRHIANTPCGTRHNECGGCMKRHRRNTPNGVGAREFLAWDTRGSMSDHQVVAAPSSWLLKRRPRRASVRIRCLMPALYAADAPHRCARIHSTALSLTSTQRGPDEGDTVPAGITNSGADYTPATKSPLATAAALVRGSVQLPKPCPPPPLTAGGGVAARRAPRSLRDVSCQHAARDPAAACRLPSAHVSLRDRTENDAMVSAKRRLIRPAPTAAAVHDSPGQGILAAIVSD